MFCEMYVFCYCVLIVWWNYCSLILVMFDKKMFNYYIGCFGYCILKLILILFFFFFKFDKDCFNYFGIDEKYLG